MTIAGSAQAWARIRSNYPGALTKTYLDSACKGIPSQGAVASIEAYCREVRECAGRSATADTIEFMGRLDSARLEAAALIGAHEDEIALVESTQHGLNVLALALDLGPGDRVVTDDLEFLAAVIPWQAMAARGVELAVVPHRCGRIEVADLDAAIDRRTRAVVVSAVQEVTGERLDLSSVADACHRCNVPLIVDGAQYVGALNLDVRATGIDALAVGAHKWLCSPFGLGFLYVRRELRDHLVPPVRGYMSIVAPAQGWDAYLSDPRRPAVEDFRFVAAARKLEAGGTGPYLAAGALAASIATLRDIGLTNVQARVTALAAMTGEMLDDAGMRVISPREPARSSGIVTFTTGNVDADRELLEALLANGVVVSLRYVSGVGGIRASPHFYSNEGDIERLTDVVLRHMRSRAAPRMPVPPAGRVRASDRCG